MKILHDGSSPPILVNPPTPHHPHDPSQAHSPKAYHLPVDQAIIHQYSGIGFPFL